MYRPPVAQRGKKGSWILIGRVWISPSGRQRGGRGRRSRWGRNGLLRCCIVRFLLNAFSRVGGWGFGRQQPLLLPLLLLHPAVLEPYFHLSLVQLQRSRDLHAPRPGQVLVEVELLFQLRQLLGGEVGPDRVRLTPIAVLPRPACRQRGIDHCELANDEEKCIRACSLLTNINY